MNTDFKIKDRMVKQGLRGDGYLCGGRVNGKDKGG
jgi:hypothetical protein